MCLSKHEIMIQYKPSEHEKCLALECDCYYVLKQDNAEISRIQYVEILPRDLRLLHIASNLYKNMARLDPY